jgi:predicted dehydrogenase
MPSIRLGIVGCGRVTRQLHLPALRSVPALKVAAVVDVDSERLNTVADHFQIPRRSTDARELFEDPEVDAIAICVPAIAHAELALAALAAGKHLFVEKPLAVQLSDGERMVAAAKTSGKIAIIGFNLRCHRLVRRAREVIASGALGSINQVITVWGSDMQHDPEMSSWRRTAATGGGALCEIGVHHIDVCSFLLQDQIELVQTFSRSGACEDESVSLLARSRAGTLISCSFSQVTSPINEIRMVGDKGVLSFSLFRADSFSVRKVGRHPDSWRVRLGPPWRIREFPELLSVARSGGDYALSIREEWLQFAAAVLGEAPPICSFVDGLVALRVLQSAAASSVSGAPVKVGDPTFECRPAWKY